MFIISSVLVYICASAKSKVLWSPSYCGLFQAPWISLLLVYNLFPSALSSSIKGPHFENTGSVARSSEFGFSDSLFSNSELVNTIPASPIAAESQFPGRDYLTTGSTSISQISDDGTVTGSLASEIANRGLTIGTESLTINSDLSKKFSTSGVAESYIHQAPIVAESYIQQDPVVAESYIHQDPVVAESYIQQDPVVAESYIQQDPVFAGSYIQQGPEVADDSATSQTAIEQLSNAISQALFSSSILRNFVDFEYPNPYDLLVNVGSDILSKAGLHDPGLVDVVANVGKAINTLSGPAYFGAQGHTVAKFLSSRGLLSLDNVLPLSQSFLSFVENRANSNGVVPTKSLLSTVADGFFDFLKSVGINLDAVVYTQLFHLFAQELKAAHAGIML